MPTQGEITIQSTGGQVDGKWPVIIKQCSYKRCQIQALQGQNVYFHGVNTVLSATLSNKVVTPLTCPIPTKSGNVITLCTKTQVLTL